MNGTLQMPLEGEQGQPLFSILMCVYNKTQLLRESMESVLSQEESSFELLVLDNSDSNREHTWEILSELPQRDSRIKIFRSDKNIGWAKGVSVLLAKASGRYMTFLAADDVLLPGALTKVRREIQEYGPDIVWVGNKFYEYHQISPASTPRPGDMYKKRDTEAAFFCNGTLKELGESVPFKKQVLRTRHAVNIKNVMEHVFYNSFFHYEKIEFLKKADIDFFDSGYGDCAGMTKAMAEAECMVILDQAVYGLTANTSQSRGTFYWNGDQYIFSRQWESIKHACIRDSYFSFQELRYCAATILKNQMGNIHSMAEGCKCVDRQMNLVHRDGLERLLQMKQVLENSSIQEMLPFWGRFEYEQEFLTSVEKLFESYPPEDKQIFLQSGWLGKLIEAGYSLQNGRLQRKQGMSAQDLEGFQHALTAPENGAMFGMGLFLQMADQTGDDVLLEKREVFQTVCKAYQNWKDRYVELVWNDISQGGRLAGNGKVELAAFCKYVLDN